MKEKKENLFVQSKLVRPIAKKEGSINWVGFESNTNQRKKRGKLLNLKAPNQYQLLQSNTSCFQMFFNSIFPWYVVAVVVASYNSKAK